jgi:hypothetical protein
MAIQKKERSKEAREIFPDAWQRFERAVDAAVKSGPKHKIGKHKAKASPKAKAVRRRKSI